MLLFVAVPLSGLTFELDRVRARGLRLVDIFGPNPATFNLMGTVNLPQQVRANWRSGRLTTPLSNTILYAPNGTPNVSETYYQDQITSSETRNNLINVFSGPVVEEMVYGNAWGIQANISCRVVPSDGLKLLRIRGWNDYAVFQFFNASTGNHGEPGYQDINSTGPTKLQSGSPVFVNETGVNFDRSLYSLILATDGHNHGDAQYNSDPFNTSQAQPEFQETVDGKLNLQPGRVPVALVEAFLWQGALPDHENDVMDDLLRSTSPLVTKSRAPLYGYKRQPVDVAGFGVQCKVQSTVANVTLDPATHTYSNFTHGTVARPTGGDSDVHPIHLQAFQALSNYNQVRYEHRPRTPERDDSTWLAIHFALGIGPEANTTIPKGLSVPKINYPALRPEDLQLALHKLLGEALIASMDRGGQSAWKGSLRGLDEVVYLKPGVVSFWPILALLGLWAALHIGMTLAALWKKRWAATLGGFELFRLGAAYQEELNSLEHDQFQQSSSLTQIPGMVGVLPGTMKDVEPSFIGLSEVAAHQDGVFVLDRHQANRDAP